MSSGFSTCCYCIDSDDRLAWFNQQWLSFARENGGGELLEEENRVGATLWDFVAGEATRKLYAKIQTHVRTTGRAVVLPVRCDSPRMRRQMRLTISLVESGKLFYESKLLWARPQGPLDLLDITRDRSAESMSICSCCNRAFTPLGGWEEVADASVRMHLLEMTQVPKLDYTVCPECENAFSAACDQSP